MDTIDSKIIGLLTDNARTSASDISKKLHMSVPAITERMRKLEKSGIIAKYTIQLDHSKLNRNLMAYIFISFESSKLGEDICEFIRGNEDIVECSFITGDYDYIIKVVTEDSDSLTKLIHQIKNFNKVRRTRTIVILENIKNEINSII